MGGSAAFVSWVVVVNTIVIASDCRICRIAMVLVCDSSSPRPILLHKYTVGLRDLCITNYLSNTYCFHFKLNNTILIFRLLYIRNFICDFPGIIYYNSPISSYKFISTIFEIFRSVCLYIPSIRFCSCEVRAPFFFISSNSKISPLRFLSFLLYAILFLL